MSQFPSSAMPVFQIPGAIIHKLVVKEDELIISYKNFDLVNCSQVLRFDSQGRVLSLGEFLTEKSDDFEFYLNSSYESTLAVKYANVIAYTKQTFFPVSTIDKREPEADLKSIWYDSSSRKLCFVLVTGTYDVSAPEGLHGIVAVYDEETKKIRIFEGGDYLFSSAVILGNRIYYSTEETIYMEELELME